jgi:uncharacterized protein (TIGR02271 family)
MKSDRQPIVVPVIAETLDVTTRELERLGARLTKTVNEHTETVDLPLMEERTEIERIPVNRAVDTAPMVRHEGDAMIVPVMEEVLVTEKRLVLREELHIRKRKVEVRTRHQVTLRREHVEIDRPEHGADAGPKEIE